MCRSRRADVPMRQHRSLRTEPHLGPRQAYSAPRVEEHVRRVRKVHTMLTQVSRGLRGVPFGHGSMVCTLVHHRKCAAQQGNGADRPRSVACGGEWPPAAAHRRLTRRRPAVDTWATHARPAAHRQPFDGPAVADARLRSRNGAVTSRCVSLKCVTRRTADRVTSDSERCGGQLFAGRGFGLRALSISWHRG